MIVSHNCCDRGNTQAMLLKKRRKENWGTPGAKSQTMTRTTPKKERGSRVEGRGYLQYGANLVVVISLPKHLCTSFQDIHTIPLPSQEPTKTAVAPESPTRVPSNKASTVEDRRATGSHGGPRRDQTGQGRRTRCESLDCG